MSLDENSEATDVMDQIGTYVALQMDSQYRTHTFFVFIVGNYARLMRWDRSGIIVTDRIKYNTEPELVEFFERYNAAPPEVRAATSLWDNPLMQRFLPLGACILTSIYLCWPWRSKMKVSMSAPSATSLIPLLLDLLSP
jgi:hypothetical protein